MVPVRGRDRRIAAPIRRLVAVGVPSRSFSDDVALGCRTEFTDDHAVMRAELSMRRTKASVAERLGPRKHATIS